MTHDHDTPDPRPETLRERLDNAFITEYHQQVFLRQGNPMYDGVRVANLALLAEIEQRAAARGYTELVGYPWYIKDDTAVGEDISDFIAEIRGEISE